MVLLLLNPYLIREKVFFVQRLGLEAGPQEFKFFTAQEQYEDLGPEDAACTANGNRVITVVEGRNRILYLWLGDLCN
jgi:hypothetical protein